MTDPDPINGLTIDDLRRYIAGGNQGISAGEADDDFLGDALAGAIGVAELYLQERASVGLPESLSIEAAADDVRLRALRDGVLALGARRYHERNNGYQDALVGGDGMINWFKALPVSVKLPFDLYANANRQHQQFIIGW